MSALPHPDLVGEFEQSLNRCFAGGTFADAFYDRFLGSSVAVRERFSQTNFEKQKKVIESSLYLMARAALGLSDGISHLESISESHSRRKLDIAPSLYDLWLECLIDTAKEFDREFTADLEAAWRSCLGHGIEAMVAVYRREQTTPPRHPTPSQISKSGSAKSRPTSRGLGALT